QDMAAAQRLEAGLEDIRRAVSSLRESRMAVEVKKAEIRVQLGTVESTLLGTYQVDPATLLDQPVVELGPERLAGGEEPIPEGRSAVDEAALREQLQKIREKLDRLGPVNLAAIQEHQEIDERHRFLTTQELQLVEVPADETGEARGPQEPGVDIVVQPPGKRLKSITMLSGGEKTLTAMALLFASFLIRPTPFCILDEIDAPLDEENIGRFTGVLRELSQDAQFMVITHSKQTMAIADSLFGVTMEEPGISKIVSVRLSNLQPV